MLRRLGVLPGLVIDPDGKRETLLASVGQLSDLVRDVAVVHFASAVLRPEVGMLFAAKLMQDVEAAYHQSWRAIRGKIRFQRRDLAAHHQAQVARVSHPDFRHRAGIEDAKIYRALISVTDAAFDPDVFEVARLGVPVVDG